MAVAFKIFLKVATVLTFIFGIVIIGISVVTIVGVKNADASAAADSTDEADSNQTTTGRWEGKIPKFGVLNEHYKKIIIGCLVGTIIVGVIQVISSLSLLFSCSKDLQKGLKYWLISDIIILLVLLICLVMSQIYDPESGERLEFGDIKNKVNKKFQDFAENSSLENALDELNSYYIAVGVNEGILLIFLIVFSAAYCMKCGENQYDQIN